MTMAFALWVAEVHASGRGRGERLGWPYFLFVVVLMIVLGWIGGLNGKSRPKGQKRHRKLVVVLFLVGLSAACAGAGAEKAYAEGLAAYNRADMSAAVTFFAKSVELKPDNAHYRYGLGLSYLKLRQLDAAEFQFREALRIDPAYLDASRGLTASRRAIEARAQP